MNNDNNAIKTSAESIRKAPEWLEKENQEYRIQIKAYHEYVLSLKEQISEYQETIKAVLAGLDAMLDQPGRVSPAIIRTLKAGTEKEFEQVAAKEKPLIIKY